jgi:hypothetical protein
MTTAPRTPYMTTRTSPLHGSKTARVHKKSIAPLAAPLAVFAMMADAFQLLLTFSSSKGSTSNERALCDLLESSNSAVPVSPRHH